MPRIPNAPTPASLGYRMPAEWEPHQATWIAWPHNRSDWPGKFPAIPLVYVDIVRNLARVEDVHIVVDDARQGNQARELLLRSNVDLARVKFHRWPTNRVWLRDSGPIFVTRSTAEGGQEMAVTNWRFNAWAKYHDWQKDDMIPDRVARLLGLRQWKPELYVNGRGYRLVLEGGSIDVNGRGALLTTEECLLSNVQARNPDLARADLEKAFHDFLGVRTVLWLERGIAGDDTHGHVDDIARFAAPGTVLAVVEPSRNDQNHTPLQQNLERLRAMRDQDGKQLTVVELPMPKPVVYEDTRLPASYANFYIANGLVLAPVFNDPNDRIALNTLAEVFADREIVPIYCGDFIWGLGAIHCMTQQQPKV